MTSQHLKLFPPQRFLLFLWSLDCLQCEFLYAFCLSVITYFLISLKIFILGFTVLLLYALLDIFETECLSMFGILNEWGVLT